jgi:sugar lactone lactonase YvrE
VNPKNGDVVCSIPVPAVKPTDLTFGECPNKNNDKLNCLYVTTHRLNVDSPTEFDGALLVVEGTGSEGVLPNKLAVSGILDEEFIA